MKMEDSPMKITSKSCVLYALVLLLLCPALPAQFSETFVDDDFTSPIAPNFNSIQAAIDNTDASGTVNVAAGLYTETPTNGIPLIVIPPSKSGLKLYGAQRDVDPRVSFGTTRLTPNGVVESVIEGNGSSAPNFSLLQIQASDVVVNGFLFRGEDPDLVESPNDIDISNITISYNIFDNTADEGLQLRDVTGSLIEYNLFTDTGGDGLSVCCGSSRAVIQHNELARINTTNAAIYLYSPPATGLEAIIFNNLIRDVTNNDAIYMGIRNGDDANIGGTAGIIINNTIHTINHDGIQVFADGLTIQGNQIYNIAPTASGAYGGIAIRDDVSGVFIQNNTIRDSTFMNAESAGIYIASGVNWTEVSADNNNFINFNQRAINNLSGTTVTAQRSWWNATDGPDDDAMIINGSGERISLNVDASDFVTTPVVGVDSLSELSGDPDFGTTPVRVQVSRTFSVRNPSTTESLFLFEPGFTFSGENPEKFVIAETPNLPRLLQPGEEIVDAYVLRFTSDNVPDTTFTATATLTATGSNPATLDLIGRTRINVSTGLLTR
jgi:hypothetical protein